MGLFQECVFSLTSENNQCFHYLQSLIEKNHLLMSVDVENVVNKIGFPHL